jgi:uncharacterized protein (DUF3820 family)
MSFVHYTLTKDAIMSIEDNVAARKEAASLVLLAREVVGTFPQAAHEAFWDELRKTAIEMLPTAPKVVQAVMPMTYEEAGVFGKTLMPFGEYRGTAIDDIALHRLQWYVEQDDSNFKRDLARYLASERIQQEQE